ncbi:MAG: hypothetical protein HRU19_20795 [Pseudobacteriovorax sp.]|nr:hypothetical protein [Pseudobacteriovorax sp.]
MVSHELKKQSQSRDKSLAYHKFRMLMYGDLGDRDSFYLDPAIVNFESRFGFAPLGLKSLLDLPTQFFQNEFAALRRWDYVITQAALIQPAADAFRMAKSIINTRAGRNSDEAYKPLFGDIVHQGEKTSVDSILIDALMEKVILPKEKDVTFEQFGFGNEVIVTNLDSDFFNHADNILLKRVESETESTKIFRLAGMFRINDLGRYLQTVALVASGNPRSASYQRLLSEYEKLSCRVNAMEDCAVADIVINEASLNAAYPVLGFFETAIETAKNPSIIETGI